MNIITQDLRFRQSVVKYYFRNDATATAAQYKVSRETVYRWVNKYVPSKCLTKELKERGERYYQYTAIDEYTRMRVIWFAKEHSTYESSQFVDVIIKKFPFKIKEVQTDNGFEFTTRLQHKNNPNRPKTLFEKKLSERGIHHKMIKPYTPRHNGKVERSHRKDQERFYYNKVFYSFEDLINRSKYWIKVYNNFPMRPLG